MIEKCKNNCNAPVKIEYAPVTDFDLIKYYKDNFYSLFKTNQDWQELYSTTLTIKIKTEHNTSFYGLIPKTEVIFSSKGYDDVLFSQLLSISNLPVILKFSYADGSELILGTNNSPCLIQFVQNTEMVNTNSFKIIINDILRNNLTINQYNLLVSDNTALLIADDTLLIL